jgi:ABC-type Mn2+/Zn2+ transport system permease subunit
MKQKIITFIVGFLIYGSFFGFIMYFIEDNMTVYKSILAGVFFGIAMALFEVFINPRIKNYFSNKRNIKK